MEPNYDMDYIKEQMRDFDEFVSCVRLANFTRYGDYSIPTLASLYTVMKRGK